ncbi:unnamed protein product [Musa acuminata subsp. burmannicoides]
MDIDSGGRGREAAAWWMDIAHRRLRERDLVGSKRFAERAVEVDPLIGGADQVIAVADVLLASQRRVNNHVDWYAVLQLDPSSPAGRHPSAVRSQFRRLALLLSLVRHHLDIAASAAKLVDDAWAVLSDPSKKALFDAELDMATAALPRQRPVPTFWTACPSCCYLHKYSCDYEGKNLRCPSCRRAFHAAPLQAEPPVVPDTDMYYCSWGFFPLGFSDGAAAGAPGLDAQSKPFYPMSPCHQPHPSKQTAAVVDAITPPVGGTTALKVTPLSSMKRAVAKKKVGGGLRKRVLVSESQTRTSEGTKVSSVMDMNAEAGSSISLGSSF